MTVPHLPNYEHLCRSFEHRIEHRRFVFPSGAEITAEPGVFINPGDVIARIPAHRSIRSVNAAGYLKLDPGKMLPYIKVRQGDSVEQGTVLAERQAFGITIAAPCTGVVETISQSSGLIIIRETDGLRDSFSPVAGLVRSRESYTVDIEISGSFMFALWGAGRPVWGPLLVYRDDMPDASQQGMITVFLRRIEKSDINYAIRCGAKGVIAVSAEAQDIEELVCSVTAPVEKGFPISMMLLHGFGEQEVTAYGKQFFAKRNGVMASIDPRWGAASGYEAPELIVFEEQHRV